MSFVKLLKSYVGNIFMFTCMGLLARTLICSFICIVRSNSALFENLLICLRIVWRHYLDLTVTFYMFLSLSLLTIVNNMWIKITTICFWTTSIQCISRYRYLPLFAPLVYVKQTLRWDDICICDPRMTYEGLVTWLRSLGKVPLFTWQSTEQNSWIFAILE